MAAISTPTITVNNEPIKIVPNSFKSVFGRGEVKVRAASTGGAGSQTIHTEDAETKIGKMEFEMYNEAETKRLVNAWKQNIGTNNLQAQQPGQVAEVLPFASLVNDPEFEGSADGKVKVEFQGDPITSNF